MTTTQPTKFSNKHGRTLRIEPDGVRIATPEREMAFFFNSPEQAHRAALAILTDPGRVDHAAFLAMADGPSKAARALFDHFAALDARAAAEAEAAELDRRAEVAYEARREALNMSIAIWEGATAEVQDAYRAVVRALDADAEARRLHTNKETQHG